MAVFSFSFLTEEVFRPTTLVQDHYAPYFTADEFAANINALAEQGTPKKIIANIRGQRVFGNCMSAKNIHKLPFVKPLMERLPHDGVLIDFHPEVTGKYFITYGAANGNEAREISEVGRQEEG